MILRGPAGAPIEEKDTGKNVSLYVTKHLGDPEEQNGHLLMSITVSGYSEQAKEQRLDVKSGSFICAGGTRPARRWNEYFKRREPLAKPSIAFLM